jgi:predicted Zn-dependent protease
MKATRTIRAWLIAVCAGAITVLGGCAINPVSGERQFVLVSEDQEVAIGRQGAESVAQTIGLVDDAGLQSYVQGLGARLAADAERPHLPWSFNVIDDPTPNAFAFPGGYIFITRGLMGLMGNEAELVSVLGHEIGHVTARHSVAMMTRAQVAQIGLGVGSILSPTIAEFGELAAGGISLLFLRYGREAERQADELGFRYALEHDYDVREMVNVFASLQQAGNLAGASPLPQWLSSHPFPEERISLIEARIGQLDRSLAGTVVGTDQYLQYLDGMVFGVNPRHGYFDENRFLHPDLRFRLTFPENWRTSNLPQSVTAGSPAEDAIIQLTLAQGTVDDAANRFFNQDGMVPGRVARQTINGLAAVVGRFQAQTEGGELGGVAAFIRHGEHTYRVLAYTPAAQLTRYDGTFMNTVGSFAPLTDRNALARQPDRIAIVRVTDPMTLAAFDQRYPSVISIEQLALINQLPGPGARIAAGTLVKRVVNDP